MLVETSSYKKTQNQLVITETDGKHLEKRWSIQSCNAYLSLQVKSCHQDKVTIITLTLLMLVSLAPPLWALYRKLARGWSSFVCRKMAIDRMPHDTTSNHA